MKKFIECIARVRPIYNVDNQNLMEKHELGRRKNQCGTLDLVSPGLSYNEQKALNDNNVDYVVFTTKDMKDTAKIPEMCDKFESACARFL